MSNKLIDLNALSTFKTYMEELIPSVFYVTVPANGWSNEANAVTVQGITATDNVEIVGFNPTGMSTSAAAAAKDALGLITYGDTSANTITFYAVSGTVPSVDIPIILRKLV